MAGSAPISLLHVFPSFAAGGQQTRFATLAGAMGSGFHHYVAALDGDYAAAAALKPASDISFCELAGRKSRLFSPTAIKAARKLIEKINPDILCTYNWGAIEAAFANWRGQHIAHIHFEDGFGPDETPDRQKIGRVLARRMILKNSVVVVPSQTLESIALSCWGLGRDRVRCIANGIDVARFSKGRCGNRNDGVVVGTVCALRPEKNVPRLVRAFAMADREALAQLAIVGEGPARQSIETTAKQCGAGARVKLVGATAAPETAYHGFDIFALTSDTEQAPLSLMEAMAAGLPVAAFDVGDIADMVAAENRPFIVPAGDEWAFANVLRRLIAGGQIRTWLGNANAARAQATFGLESMVEAHKALYLEAAGRSS
ncbi:MAG: glycosyltransferase [Parvularculaceae bacterium]